MNKLPFGLSRIAAMIVLPLALALSGCGINAIPTKEETAKAKWADVQENRGGVRSR